MIATLSILCLVLLAGGVWYLARFIQKTALLEETVDEVLQAMQPAPDNAKSSARMTWPSQLPIGAPALPFEGRDRTLFIFVSDNCSPCEALKPDLETWRERISVKVVNKDGSELAGKCRVEWTPTAVLVGSDGGIASDTAFGDVEIRSLVEHSMRERAPWQREGCFLKVGSSLPEVRARDAGGKSVSLAEAVRAKSFILFWNPYADYCDELIRNLRAWKRSENLILISSGPPDAELDVLPGARVLYANGKEAEMGFGVWASPAAVLVDEHGRIASSIASGLADVRSLAGWE